MIFNVYGVLFIAIDPVIVYDNGFVNPYEIFLGKNGQELFQGGVVVEHIVVVVFDTETIASIFYE